MGLAATQKDRHNTHTHTCKHNWIPPAAPKYSCIYFEKATLAKRSYTKSFIINLTSTYSSLIEKILSNLLYDNISFFYLHFWKTWRSISMYLFSVQPFESLIYFLHYHFFIVPLWPPSFHSLSWFSFSEDAEGCYLISPPIFHFSSTFLSLFKVAEEGYFILTFFYLLHNNLPSILPPVDLPLLWGYSDLFTTLPPSLLFQSFIHPSSSLSSITDTVIPPSLSSVFSSGCLCLLDSLPCCLLTVLAFLEYSPSTL